MRLRGGAADAAAAAPSASAVLHARMLILLSGVIYGTYPVLLRALQYVGGEPFPAVFVTFVRYQFLTLFALIAKGITALRSSGGDGAEAASTAADGPSHSSTGLKTWLAAAELATYTVINALTATWGIARVSAVTSEILSATTHVFVPLQTLALVGNASFGRNTGLGCLLAFVAALLSCLADSAGSGAAASASVDWLGNGAVVLSSFVFGLQKVRTQVLLRDLDPARVNSSRMICMGAFSIVVLLADVLAGGGSRVTLGRLHHTVPLQWAILALSVFLSAYVASNMQFTALKTISAANSQPFQALQPLFAAGWSTALLSEPITRGNMIGGVIMMGSTLLACADKTGPGEDKKKSA